MPKAPPNGYRRLTLEEEVKFTDATARAMVADARIGQIKADLRAVESEIKAAVARRELFVKILTERIAELVKATVIREKILEGMGADSKDAEAVKEHDGVVYIRAAKQLEETASPMKVKVTVESPTAVAPTK